MYMRLLKAEGQNKNFFRRKSFTKKLS